MKLIKENYKLFVLLYFFWIVLTLDFQLTNLIIGLGISSIVSAMTKWILYDKSKFKIDTPMLLNVIKFFFRLMIEIYKSSFSYIVRIIKKDCEPIFIEINLNTKNPLIITMISNAITLTPGTLTVDTDKNKLMVLSIDDPTKKGTDLNKEIKEKYEEIF
ncbi:Na+/H+ antiporter subunit E [Sporosalibacterium faouarense]|uniref:Na+/H+ antiporter subunit E n=1 Tax=Sporosalibacterium faouarense TaxID=516123 RepID=UPI00141CEF1E|nr:Na+/H+ antiporter subunit E [Sporosalibacterium faouarense]MTI48475.1 hypothetical protein [Bacillota bacterium]